jgi:hypothetical protein
MKQRGSPLWLVRDILCWIGIVITLPAFAKALHRIVTAMQLEGRRNLYTRELSLAARLLADAEAWMLYAITRRAFKLAGLKPGRVCFPDLSEAATLDALKSRGRQLTYTYNNLDSRARQMAQRLLRLCSERRRATTTTRKQHRNNATARPARTSAPRSRRNRAGASNNNNTTTTKRAGQRVRAPPWRSYSLFPRPIPLCRPATENVPACPIRLPCHPAAIGASIRPPNSPPEHEKWP